MCVSPQRCAIFRHLNFKKCSEHGVFCTFWLQNARFATAACNFSTSQLQKVFHFDFKICVSPQRRAILRHLNFKKALPKHEVFLYILTSKCAFRHSGVQFFDISTSKNAPRLWVFLTFWLQNVRFATAVCNFSTSQLQKVLRTWGVLYILTSKCAFRHSSVQFLISLLSTYLRARRFNRPTFRLTGHTNHWKTEHFATF